MTLGLGPELFARLNAEQWVGNQTPVVYGAPGLPEKTVAAIEKELGFPWPDDYRYLFQNVSDPGGVLFRWEDEGGKSYAAIIQRVLEGIEFDVQMNNLWMRRWHERPRYLPDALAIVRNDFPSWPKLLPIYGHRFLAAQPNRAGNPVFSIVQTDIVYYGSDIAHYLVNEFLDHDWPAHTQGAKHIDIWSAFAEERGGDLLAFPQGPFSSNPAPWSSSMS